MSGSPSISEMVLPQTLKALGATRQLLKLLIPTPHLVFFRLLDLANRLNRTTAFIDFAFINCIHCLHSFLCRWWHKYGTMPQC